jgi:diguanylate cyclase (GGDEF)-like protein/PAS domain S-box-containing protein
LHTPPLTHNEIERLIALKSFKILDTEAEEIFDDFTRLASQICGTPIGLITLVDENRQWFKSSVGLAASETARDISFCGHAILGPELFEVQNALLDERFADNPLVTGNPDIRFYAGMPLITAQGHALGTLCVIDTIPRQLTAEQQAALKMLARQVVSQIASHLTLLQMTALNEELAQRAAFDDTLLRSVEQSIISLNSDGIITSFSAGAETMLGYQAHELIGQKTALILHDIKEVSQRAIALGLVLDQSVQSQLQVLVVNARAEGSETDEWSYIRKDGSRLMVSLTVTAMYDLSGVLTGFLGVARDITADKKVQQSLVHMTEILQHTGEIARVGGWELDLTTMQLNWSSEVFRIHELDQTHMPSVETAINYFAPESQPVINAAVALAISHGVPWDLELQLITAKANRIWVRAQGSAVMQDGKAHSLKGVFQEITEHKNNQLNLARLNRELMMLSKCNEVLMHMTDETALIVEICRIVVDVGGYKMAWVGYAESDAEHSITAQASFGATDFFLLNQNMSWSDHLANELSPAAQTIRSGQVTAVSDVMQAPDYLGKELAAQLGFRALVYLPLNNKGHTYGLLALYSAETRSFAHNEISLLQELTDNLASGIVNIRAEHEREQLYSAMLKIATAVTVSASETFFTQLVSNMISALGAQAGYVAELISEQPWHGQTIAVQVDDQVMANYDYPIPDALAERLFGKGDVCIVTEHAARDYPDISMMRFFKYQAFAALKLRSSVSQALGLVFVFFKQPMKPQSSELIDSMLKIFASRTAAELERMKAEALMQEQASLLDKSRDAIVVRDLEHRVTYWNKGAEALYGWTAKDTIGQNTYSMLKLELSPFDQAMTLLHEKGEWVGELVKRHQTGQRLVIEARWTLVKNKQGQATSIFSIESNISDRKIEEEAIRQLAFFDPLTQLPNRRLLMTRLEQALEKTADNKDYGALIFIDLDNFKKLNDTMGHEQGDLLLQAVANGLKGCVREQDTVARLGGDEFVVMLQNLNVIRSKAQLRAVTIGNKILAKLDQSFSFDGYVHQSSSSIGIALFNRQTKSMSDLLKQADTAMYRSKASGRNTLSFFE